MQAASANAGEASTEMHLFRAPSSPDAPVPLLLPTRVRTPAGETFVELPSGASACVCHLIPGDLPKTADPTTLGRSVGELLMGLGKVGDPGGYRTPPYYEVYEVHHACSKDKSAPRLRTRPTSSILAERLISLSATPARLGSAGGACRCWLRAGWQR